MFMLLYCLFFLLSLTLSLSLFFYFPLCNNLVKACSTLNEMKACRKTFEIFFSLNSIPTNSSARLTPH